MNHRRRYTSKEDLECISFMLIWSHKKGQETRKCQTSVGKTLTREEETLQEGQSTGLVTAGEGTMY